MKRDNEKRLFENMEKINPDYKRPVDEAIGDAAKFVDATKRSPILQTANMRIDTSEEFKSAFVTFLMGTGLYQKGLIHNPNDVRIWVNDALTKPQYGFQLLQKK
jgi:hypothetical protein